jgi:Double zinc ribbon
MSGRLLRKIVSIGGTRIDPAFVDCLAWSAEHAPALQAGAALDQARQKVAQVDQTRGLDVAHAAAAVRTCPNCQASLAGAARFCAQCGNAVAAAQPRFCSGCGEGLPLGARFCSGCGAVAPG